MDVDDRFGTGNFCVWFVSVTEARALRFLRCCTLRVAEPVGIRGEESTDAEVRCPAVGLGSEI